MESLEMKGKMKRQKAFLDAYAKCGRISQAAEAAGIDRTLHYKWLKGDREYMKEFDKSEEEIADRLQEEAMRRVFEGVERQVYYKGEEVGVVREYSNALLMFLLRAHQPEKYNERLAAPEVKGRKGRSGGSLNIVVEGGLNQEVFGAGCRGVW